MWIARDKSGLLTLFVDGKPIRMNRPYDPNLDDRDYTGCWLGHRWGCRKIELDESLFPNLTWEDEPIEVRLVTDNDLKDVVDLTLQFTHLPLKDQVDISTKMYVHDYYLKNQ